ncbi:MAG: hypothetical protein JST22_02760 [Bacteroidetes bacterium]|nr:hypothetical protein [Bacteroidota bacterium]
MPVILNATCRSPVITLEQPFDVEVAIRTDLPGPISFHFTIAEELPYFIVANAEPTKSLVCQRSFGVADEYRARFALQVCRASPGIAALALKVTASGLDGTSIPFHLGLSLE